jgi:hypothetical protein
VHCHNPSNALFTNAMTVRDATSAGDSGTFATFVTVLRNDAPRARRIAF